MKFTVIPYKEILFQVVLYLLMFTMYAFDKHELHFEPYKIVFFLNYIVGTLIISYVLLPKLLYRKKYFLFILFTLVVVSFTVAVEEGVLEQIYFPDTKGRYFPVFPSLIDVFPVLIMLSGSKFAWDALGKQIELDELKETIKESELQFLKSQINPHFLFNNLNNLYAYAIENSPKTPTIILELSSVLRYMLYECKEPYVPLGKEIKHLEDFTQLNQLQIEERGHVSFHKEGIKSNYQIAPLILIVFIENAFKHSQSSQSDNIKIKIEVVLSDFGQLDFYCTNSFQKLTNTDRLSKGIGLANVRKRLNLLYPNAYQLTLDEMDEEYRAHLSLQLSKI